jgi:hypothetical protein
MGNYGLEKLSWALIYGGLVVLCIGIFMRAAAPAAARVLAAGAAIAAVGALLIWVRSRRKN